MYLHKILRALQRIYLLGEDVNGSVTEIESRDIIFLREDFPERGEIDKDTHFYEMEDHEVGDGVCNIPKYTLTIL